MNVKQFKIHLMRGLIRPEYFYIPILMKEQATNSVFVELFDENNNHINVKRIQIYYNTDMLYHNFERDEQGNYNYEQDEKSKGYAFETDTEWRYPVPNPSQWEILPLPDFTQNPPIIENAEIISVSQLSITFNFEPKYLIEIKNMPIGHGNIYIGITKDFFDNYELINSIEYYPTYYNEYQYPLSVYHSSGNYQIDRNGKFSGFAQYQYSHPQYYFPNGYDFYCITQKFNDNTMPITVNYKTGDVYKIVVAWVDVPNFTNRSVSSKQEVKNARGKVLWDVSETVSKFLGYKFYKNGEYIGYIVYHDRLSLSNVPNRQCNITSTEIMDDKEYVVEYSYNNGDDIFYNFPPVTISVFMPASIDVANYSGAYNSTSTVAISTPAFLQGQEEYEEFYRYSIYARLTDSQITSVAKYGNATIRTIVSYNIIEKRRGYDEDSYASTDTFYMSLKALKSALDNYQSYPNGEERTYIYDTTTEENLINIKSYHYYNNGNMTSELMNEFINAYDRNNLVIDFEN